MQKWFSKQHLHTNRTVTSQINDIFKMAREESAWHIEVAFPVVHHRAGRRRSKCSRQSCTEIKWLVTTPRLSSISTDTLPFITPQLFGSHLIHSRRHGATLLMTQNLSRWIACRYLQKTSGNGMSNRIARRRHWCAMAFNASRNAVGWHKQNCESQQLPHQHGFTRHRNEKQINRTAT